MTPWMVGLPRWAVAVAVGVVGCGLGFGVRGPVAGMLLGGYAAAGTWAALVAAASRAARRGRAVEVDAISSLAADLRAGIPPTAAWQCAARLMALPETPEPELSADSSPARIRLAVSWRLANRLGVPLANILDLAVEDLRQEEQRTAQVAAQLAGARVTMVILIALPAVGLALGYSIGGDPLQVLLDTPLGAGCAAGAMALQLAGLGWTDRLVRHAAG